jgi:acyl dehydratase
MKIDQLTEHPGKPKGSSFTSSVEDRYFEDYVAGAVHEFGGIVAEESEMIAFARHFDPQPFHTDPEAAKQSAFGGLIASGWYTAGLMMRLYVDYYLSHVASLGSPGVDELRWLKPVRPGDALSLRVTVAATKRSRSKPDRGVVRSYVEVLNQNREVVASVKAVNLLSCRELP